jgi:predicted RND superfamily exporter protein
VSVTGQAALDADINKRLINSQISSFAISLLLIFLTILLMFRRLRIALLAMLPNILPVLVTLGTMGWLGVKLDVATVLIAAVSLGIAIDDSIHFLHAYLRQISAGNDVPAALKNALDSVGKPILITSLVLICGFLSMINSSFVPLVYLGIFFSLNIFIAYVADVIFVPALISMFNKAQVK